MLWPEPFNDIGNWSGNVATLQYRILKSTVGLMSDSWTVAERTGTDRVSRDRISAIAWTYCM